MKKFFKFTILPLLIFIFLKILYFSYRKKVEGEREILEEQGNILVFWHSKMLPIIPFLGKRNIVALVSMSEDGELISRVLKKFDYILVRGSTSRGGATALVKLIKKIKEGYSVAITPDGPRGPARVFQKGAFIITKKTKAKIVPLSYVSSKSHFFNSWDKFELPLPFSKIVLRIGTPLKADSLSGEKEEKILIKIGRMLDELEN